MSEKECLAGDWYGAGLEDGREGRLERAFDERAARCSEFGAPADGEAYFAGRKEAIAALCTDRGGYDYGLAGKSYTGVCAPETERDFLSGYLAGWRIHRAQEAREEAEDNYERALSLVENYREDIRRGRRKLRDDEATEEEIAKARKSIDRARDQLPYAERRADELLYELGRADEALAQTYETAAAYRQSDEFAFNREVLLEAHAFARAEVAIDYCTDETEEDYDFIRPQCELLPGRSLIDRDSKEVCVTGPGRATLIRRGDGYGPFEEAEYILVFGYAQRDENGRLVGNLGFAFAAMLDDQAGYLGVACPSSRAPR